MYILAARVNNIKQEYSRRKVGRSRYLLFVYIICRYKKNFPFADCATGGGTVRHVHFLLTLKTAK